MPVTTTLDLQGLSCPLPIVKTAQAMKTLLPGDEIEVLATDPGSVADFAAWTKTTGNTLLEQSQQSGAFRFIIRKE